MRAKSPRTGPRPAGASSIDGAQYFRDLFEHSPVPKWVLESGTLAILAVNDVALTRYGYSRAEFLAMTFHDIDVLDRHAMPDEARSIVGGHAGAMCARRHRTREGTPIDVEVSSHPMQFAGRHALMAAAHDVSERGSAMAALRRSEELFRALTENASEMISILDADGVIRYMSPSVRRILGFEVEELVGLRPLDLMHPDEAACIGALKAEIMAAPGTVRTYECRVRHRDGSWRHLEVRSHNLLHHPVIAGVVSNLRDVTERKRAEQAARETEMWYRVLAENFPNGAVILFDRELRFVLARGQGLKSVGLSPESYEGKTLWEAFPRAAAARLAPHYEAVVRGEAVWFETEYAERHYSAHGVPVRDESGEIQGGLIMSQDVTVQRQLEDQLRQSQKMEAVGQLAGGIAHDFNNMLTAVGSYSEFLLADLPPDDSARRDVQEIKRATEQAASLTRQLLAFSRRQVLEPETLDPCEVVRELERMLARLIGENVELRTSFPAERVFVRADPGQLEQVLVNLVVNARDAMPNGGLVHVSVESLDPATPGGTDARVRLRVRDEGVGMDETTRRRMFEPFFTTKPAGKGTGLGLSVVYGIVTQSGGDIEVESRLGEGTTVDILLARVQSAGTRRARLTPVAQRSMGGETILVVEDDPGVRTVVHRTLARAGYSLLTAENGHEGLQLAERHRDRIDLVLTDVVMPEMAGTAMVEAFERLELRAKVIYMTGYTDDDVLGRRGLEPGTQVIAKPLAPARLLETIRQALAEAHTD